MFFETSSWKMGRAKDQGAEETLFSLQLVDGKPHDVEIVVMIYDFLRCFIEKRQERMSEDEWGAVNMFYRKGFERGKNAMKPMKPGFQLFPTRWVSNG